MPAIREAPTVGDRPSLWALVLAAGAGSRFGGDKLRAPWGSKTLIEAVLDAAKASPVDGVVLLTRPSDRLLDDPSVSVVEVADWAEGMAATLRAGIATLPANCTGAYVFLGDMPRIPHAVLPLLAKVLCEGALASAPEYQGQQGHPVLFSKSLFPELLQLKGDRGARALLERLGSRLGRVEAPDDGVLFDVDQPSDLQPSGAKPRSAG